MSMSRINRPIYRRIRVKQALSRSGLPDIDYALNPYAGCFHACIYCYGRSYTRYRDAAENWGSVIYVKENLIDVLRREVRKLRRGVVGIATITDPYQPIEAREKLTRGSVELLLKHGFRVDIQTKSPLILRDIDILTKWIKFVEVGFTITTLREDIAEVIEPRAPKPSSRAMALEKLASEGISTWVFLGPIIPSVNDQEESLKEVVELAGETGSLLIYDWLRLKPEVENSLLKNLSKENDKCEWFPSTAWKRRMESTLRSLCTHYGVNCERAF